MFDFSFFVIVNIGGFCLLFGVIVDTFGELRNARKKIEKELREKCFICGLGMEDFEARTLDWGQHIKEEHNLYDYLNYII